MKDLEKLEIEKPNKTKRFMIFLQFLMTFIFIAGIIVTISPYLKMAFFILAIIVMFIITIVTLGLLLLNSNFRKLWGEVLNMDFDKVLLLYNYAYLFYGIAILFGLITSFYFFKKNDGRKERAIFSIVVLILSVIGIILNFILSKKIQI